MSSLSTNKPESELSPSSDPSITASDVMPTKSTTSDVMPTKSTTSDVMSTKSTTSDVMPTKSTTPDSMSTRSTTNVPLVASPDFRQLTINLQKMIKSTDEMEHQLKQFELLREKRVLEEVLEQMKLIAGQIKDLHEIPLEEDTDSNSDSDSESESRVPLTPKDEETAFRREFRRSFLVLGSKMKTLVEKTRELTARAPAPSKTQSTAYLPRTSTLQGHLKKLGEKGISGWKKRFFRQSATRLEYFNPKNLNLPLGFIDLAMVKEFKVLNLSQFLVVTPKRKYQLQVFGKDPAQEMRYWRDGITPFISNRPVLKPVFSSDSIQSPSAVRSKPDAPLSKTYNSSMSEAADKPTHKQNSFLRVFGMNQLEEEIEKNRVSLRQNFVGNIYIANQPKARSPDLPASNHPQNENKLVETSARDIIAMGEIPQKANETLLHVTNSNEAQASPRSRASVPHQYLPVQRKNSASEQSPSSSQLSVASSEASMTLSMKKDEAADPPSPFSQPTAEENKTQPLSNPKKEQIAQENLQDSLHHQTKPEPSLGFPLGGSESPRFQLSVEQFACLEKLQIASKSKEEQIFVLLNHCLHLEAQINKL